MFWSACLNVYETEVIWLEGDPIWVRTLSSHWRGPSWNIQRVTLHIHYPQLLIPMSNHSLIRNVTGKETGISVYCISNTGRPPLFKDSLSSALVMLVPHSCQHFKFAVSLLEPMQISIEICAKNHKSKIFFWFDNYQMNFNPTRSWGDILAVIFGAPTFHEGHPEKS